MKKIVVLLITFCLMLGTSVPVLAAEQTSTISTNIVEPRASEPHGSKTLSPGAYYYFTSHILANGKTISISYNLNKSGAIQVYFYNSTTGQTIYVTTSYGSSGSASYTASSRCNGYFYLRNASGTTITVTSATQNY